MLGSDALLKKNAKRSATARLFAARLESERRLGRLIESRAERSALGAAPDIAAVVDVGLYLKKTNDPSTISAQEACFDFARIILEDLFLRPDQNLKLGIGSA